MNAKILIIKTKRLNIYSTSDEQIKRMIAKETMPELKAAYQEMLDGCLAYPNDRVWYAIWNLELNDKYADISWGIKLSLNNIGFDNNVYTFPYFCAFLLRDWLIAR